MKIYTSLPGLRPRRLALGLKATNLADALGVTRAAWSYWESGATMPSSGYLPALAELLQCSIEDLYSDGGEKTDCHGQCEHWPRNDGTETRAAGLGAPRVGVGPYGETEARDDDGAD